MPGSFGRKQPDAQARQPVMPRQAPRVGDLRLLEQELTAATDYVIEVPRREPWAPRLEFPDDN